MKEAFGNMLRELREKAGLTMEALARKSGLSIFTIIALEKGVRQPSWETVKKLCAGLGVSCAAFEANDPFATPEAPPKTQRRTKRGGSRKEDA